VAAQDTAKTKRASRTIRLVRSPRMDGVGVFCVNDKKSEVNYVFREIPCEIGGRGFAVHRLGLGQLYHVRVGKPVECSCECLGFLAHGGCKHIQGLLKLLRGGKL
jgi:hypothetical protein